MTIFRRVSGETMIPTRHLFTVWLAMFAATCLIVGAAAAQGPLHRRIDELILRGHDGPLAGRSSDADFLRRVYLDLAGTLPSADEARAFLTDTSADKRAKLIDRLLSGPRYPRRMAEAFTVMLSERRGNREISEHAWAEYLRRSFAENKPWDQLVRELMSADGVDPASRPPIGS